jgi:ribulose 1,5-bisphosphate synthetase/thiazole synthase
MTAKKASFITEPRKKIPVSGEYDVVVVGGGIAGVAAAVAAARNSASVCLIEKENALGGLATLGNVVIYLPLCDGAGNQVIKGLGEELLKLSIKDGYKDVPECWKRGGNKKARADKRYRVEFNPMTFMLEMEEFILKNNVKLYYDTRFCDVVKNGDAIEAVVIENKSGRSALKCKSVVDASGDADVCWMAGEKTVSSDANSLSGWFYYFDGSQVKLNPFHRPFDQYAEKPVKGEIGFSGDDADDVTNFTLELRKLIKKRIKEMKKENPETRPLFMAQIPTFRMTRRHKAAYELEESDDKKFFDDAVGMTGDWRKNGPIFYIPFRSMIGVKTPNLITAGRCMAAGRTGWDITRVIPTCAVTGEAAGAAAAMLANSRRAAFCDMDVRLIQERLKKQKVIIDKKYSV